MEKLLKTVRTFSLQRLRARFRVRGDSFPGHEPTLTWGGEQTPEAESCTEGPQWAGGRAAPRGAPDPLAGNVPALLWFGVMALGENWWHWDVEQAAASWEL